MSTVKVAIIGAGAAGICAARACLSYRLSITIFDKRASIGGIWSGEDSPLYDNLTTNSAWFENSLSDVPLHRVLPVSGLSPHESLCQTSQECLEYLLSVVEKTSGLIEAFRGRTEVISLTQVAYGYDVEFLRLGNQEDSFAKCARTSVERFDYVIIASGRYSHLAIPKLPGLDTYPGPVLHSSKYENSAPFRGKRVLIVGGAISGCEIAGELASAPAEERPGHVTVSARKMRYLLVKQKGSCFPDAEVTTRFSYLNSLTGELWSQTSIESMKSYIRNLTKNEDYNAPRANCRVPAPDDCSIVIVAEKVLNASKKGLIQWNIGGISRFNEDGTVSFNDGTQQSFDIIILATGYRLTFPFLDKATQNLIMAEDAPEALMNLADFSFHPEIPRLAFVGLYILTGASLMTFDAQARYVARAIAKPETKPSSEELRAALEAYRKERFSPNAHYFVSAAEIIDRFAKLGGFELDLSVYKEWTKALIFGPLVPAQYRLFGEGKLDSALEDFERIIEGAGWKKGDNEVDSASLEALKNICKTLVAEGKAPKGLQDAVKYLCSVNDSEYGVGF